MKTYIYKKAFKILHQDCSEAADKVKLSGYNVKAAHNRKHSATNRMATIIKTDSEVKVQRLNERKIKRLEAKLAKGAINVIEYREKLAAL